MSQAGVWRSIVGSLPGGWINAPQEPLLAQYCRHVDAGNKLSKRIDAEPFDMANLGTLDRLLRMRERETRASSALETRMRLTQQARMHPRTAGRAEPSHSRLWERKPWDDGRS